MPRQARSLQFQTAPSASSFPTRQSKCARAILGRPSISGRHFSNAAPITGSKGLSIISSRTTSTSGPSKAKTTSPADRYTVWASRPRDAGSNGGPSASSSTACGSVPSFSRAMIATLRMTTFPGSLIPQGLRRVHPRSTDRWRQRRNEGGQIDGEEDDAEVEPGHVEAHVLPARLLLRVANDVESHCQPQARAHEDRGQRDERGFEEKGELNH